MSAEHVSDDDAGEVDVGDAAEAQVVELLRERGAPAPGDQDVRPLRPEEERAERGLDLRPLRVPLEAVAAAAEGEELVPVLPRGEVV